MVLDFFKNLVRYRVEGVRSAANAKVKGAQARAKGKASSKFNAAIDKPLNKAKEKAKGAAKGKQAGAQKKQDAPKAQATKQGGGNVGFFSKKKGAQSAASSGGGAAAAEDVEFEPGMHTVAIDISGMPDDHSQDVVGWIVCLNGGLRGKDFRLVTGRNVIGTAADCDVVLTDPYLSAKHMVIRHEDGRFMLIDLDSTNGTFVNDRRATKSELIDNDKIRVGRTEMKFKSLF